MKYFFILIILLSNTLIFSQTVPIDEETGKVTYSAVVEVSGATKDQLFDRVKEWFPVKEGSPRKIIYESKTEGKITGDCSFPIFIGGTSKTVYYNLEVAFKDGRYKYKTTNFFYEYGINLKSAFEDRFLPDKRDVYDVTNDKMKALFKDLATAANTPVKKKNEDDW